jgi:hypothetical protein
MTEKDAITISTVLGAVVLTFVLVLCRPFSWGSDTEVAVSGGSANASQVAVSGGTIFGGTVSGGVIGAGGGERRGNDSGDQGKSACGVSEGKGGQEQLWQLSAGI